MRVYFDIGHCPWKPKRHDAKINFKLLWLTLRRQKKKNNSFFSPCVPLISNKALLVRYHTRHEPYTQLRYAATYSTIKAFTFIDILSTYYILSYDLINILNLKSNLVRTFWAPWRWSWRIETCRSKYCHIKDCYLCNFNRNIVHLLVLLNKHTFYSLIKWGRVRYLNSVKDNMYILQSLKRTKRDI